MWALYLLANGSLGSLLLSVLALVLFSLSGFQLIKVRELLSGKRLEPSAKTDKIIEKRLQNSKDGATQYSVLGLTDTTRTKQKGGAH